MLIISGSAQYTLTDNQYNLGDLHTFTLFSKDEELDQNLTAIESYLNNLGWDEITIEETQLLADKAEFDHSVLKEGFEKANQDEFALVINNVAVTSVEVA